MLRLLFLRNINFLLQSSNISCCYLFPRQIQKLFRTWTQTANNTFTNTEYLHMESLFDTCINMHVSVWLQWHLQVLTCSATDTYSKFMSVVTDLHVKTHMLMWWYWILLRQIAHPWCSDEYAKAHICGASDMYVRTHTYKCQWYVRQKGTSVMSV